MDKNKFAFDKTNFILLGIGMAIIILGFLLMTGPGSTEGVFEPDIFSFRRIKLAPAICFFGFVFVICAIMYKKKENSTGKDNDIEKQ
jgi:membrane-bound ClpP family serine protease